MYALTKMWIWQQATSSRESTQCCVCFRQQHDRIWLDLKFAAEGRWNERRVGGRPSGRDGASPIWGYKLAWIHGTNL
jgi:hypothetical protein